MKTLFTFSTLILVTFSAQAFAQTNAPATTTAAAASAPAVTSTSDATLAPAAATTAAAPRPLLFHPPSGITDSVLPIRVGGGSRGASADEPSVMVLVPAHVALTTQAQPSLYWYQSKAARTLCEVTLVEPKKARPLLRLKSSAPTPAGIHAIRLSKFNIELKPNVIYSWNVAVIVDPDNRSQDIIARGVIERIDPSPALAAQLAQASDSDKPALYAENSIWYDALQSISDQIDHAPQDASLRAERASLLKQIGLDGASMDSSQPKTP